MKITLLQTDITHGDISGNLARIDALLERHAGSRLYVLPELFATGFCSDAHRVAEPEGGAVQTWMLRRAAAMGAALAGSVAVEGADGRVRNRLVLALPEGGMLAYDKHHLFAPGGEAEHYMCGTERPVWTLDGLRILPLVCYDLRFPVWARNRCDYDLLLVVANWPASRIYAWDVLLRARAIENQCYVAAVNRVGTEHDIPYSGHSVILDPLGRPIAPEAAAFPVVGKTNPSASALFPSEVCALTAAVSLDELEHRRRQFPVANDADRFELMYNS